MGKTYKNDGINNSSIIKNKKSEIKKMKESRKNKYGENEESKDKNN